MTLCEAPSVVHCATKSRARSVRSGQTIVLEGPERYFDARGSDKTMCRGGMKEVDTCCDDGDAQSGSSR